MNVVYQIGLEQSYLRFPRPLLYISALQHSIKLEAAILIDRRESVEVQMTTPYT